MRRSQSSAVSQEVSRTVNKIHKILLSGALLWATLSLCGYHYLIPWDAFQHLKSPHMLFDFFTEFSIHMCISILCGLLLSVPAILILIQVQKRIVAVRRTSWRLPYSLKLLERVLPFATFIFFHVGVVGLGIISHPYYVSNLGVLGTMLEHPVHRANERFFQKGEHHLSLWQNAFSKTSQAKVIVMLPSHILKTTHYFPSLRKVFPNPKTFLLGTHSTWSQLEELISGDPIINQSFQFPPIHHRQIEGALKTVGHENFKFSLEDRISLKKELSVLEKYYKGEKAALPNKEIVARHIARSSPHLFSLHRMGALGLFREAWRWGSLFENDLYHLKGLLKDRIAKEQQPEILIVQLSQHELRVNNHNLFWLSGYSRTDLSREIKIKALQDLDDFLHTGYKALKGLGGELIAIPYPEDFQSLEWSLALLPARFRSSWLDTVGVHNYFLKNRKEKNEKETQSLSCRIVNLRGNLISFQEKKRGVSYIVKDSALSIRKHDSQQFEVLNAGFGAICTQGKGKDQKTYVLKWKSYQNGMQAVFRRGEPQENLRGQIFIAETKRKKRSRRRKSAEKPILNELDIYSLDTYLKSKKWVRIPDDKRKELFSEGDIKILEKLKNALKDQIKFM